MNKNKNIKKLNLSPTKITSYNTCKTMYYYKYIKKLDKFFYKPNAYHSFGLSLHRALEEFTQQGGTQNNDEKLLQELLRQKWISRGYITKQDEDTNLACASQILSEYYINQKSQNTKTIATEKTFKRDMGNYFLSGRIDRIDEHPDGHIEIIDYKSGREHVTVDYLKNDIATQIYILLAKQNYPTQQISGSIYCLKSCTKTEAFFEKEEIEEIEFCINETGNSIIGMDNDDYPEPIWKEFVCPRCIFLKLCVKQCGWDVSDYNTA